MLVAFWARKVRWFISIEVCGGDGGLGRAAYEFVAEVDLDLEVNG